MRTSDATDAITTSCPPSLRSTPSSEGTSHCIEVRPRHRRVGALRPNPSLEGLALADDIGLPCQVWLQRQLQSLVPATYFVATYFVATFSLPAELRSLGLEPPARGLYDLDPWQRAT